MFGIGQDKGGSSRGYTGTLVLQSFFINARIIFDANGAAAGLAGHKKPDPSLAAAIVQQNIPLPDPAGSSQAFQNGIGRGLIGIPVLIGAGIISSSSLNAKETVPPDFRQLTGLVVLDGVPPLFPGLPYFRLASNRRLSLIAYNGCFYDPLIFKYFVCPVLFGKIGDQSQEVSVFAFGVDQLFISADGLENR